MHSTPRNSLFTPFKISKGPAAGQSLNRIRFTKGITSAGRRFEFHDNWQQENRKHLDLGETWIGYTVFIEPDCEWQEALRVARPNDHLIA